MVIKSILYFILSVLAFYGLIVLISHLIINQMMFFPPHTYRDNADTIKLKTENNAIISAIYLPNPKAHYTLLYSHGNAEDLGTIHHHLLHLRNFGFSIFAYDYQGYGTSEGRPSEKKTYFDIMAAYHYLTNVLHVKPQNIIIYGSSIGSGPSVYLAALKPAAALILQSPFISIFRTKTYWPLLPWDPYNNLSRITKVKTPILLMHGTEDNIIPFKHSLKLEQAIKAPLQTLFIKGAKHNDFISIAGIRYWQALKRFVDELNFQKE